MEDNLDELVGIKTVLSLAREEERLLQRLRTKSNTGPTAKQRASKRRKRQAKKRISASGRIQK